MYVNPRSQIHPVSKISLPVPSEGKGGRWRRSHRAWTPSSFLQHFLRWDWGGEGAVDPYKKVDSVALVLFAGSFVIFNAVYWRNYSI